MRVKGKVPVLN